MEKTRNFLELFTILACGFILLTPEVYHVYASREYWSSTMVIPLFVASYYLNFLCTFPVNFEYYHKKTKVVAAVTIFSSLLNVLLNYYLIRAIGMAGAALATSLSHGIQLCLQRTGICLLGVSQCFSCGLQLGVQLLDLRIVLVVHIFNVIYHIFPAETGKSGTEILKMRHNWPLLWEKNICIVGIITHLFRKNNHFPQVSQN